MQVHRRTLHVDLEVREPTQRRKYGRLAGREHRGVGDDDCFAREQVLLRLDELLEMIAPHFLLTLGDEDDVHRKPAACDEMRLERLDVKEKLSLVVHGSARVDVAVTHRRLEGRRRPELERLGWLHVVVAVHQNGRSSRCPAPLADHDWMSRGLVDRRFQARLVDRGGKPFRRAPYVGIVITLGADAWNPEKVEKLALYACIVVREELVQI